MNNKQFNVGFFITCLADFTRPNIGHAAVHLLEKNGCNVTIPEQSCCAQPAYNSGKRSEAIDIAKATIAAFEHLDYVIVPSASCAGMIKYHYPGLFEGDEIWAEKARSISERTHELISFLYNVAGMKQTDATFAGRIGFHESCSALREMKVKGPRELLSTIKGAELIEIAGNEECCGFGGLFSVKFDEISNAMVETKTRNIKQANIDLLTGVDLGCLMNIKGKLEQQHHANSELANSDKGPGHAAENSKSPPLIQVCHIAELLADMHD